MKAFRFEPSFYYLMENVFLKRLIGGYVYYLLRAGDKDFRKLSAEMNKKFEMAEDQELPCNFTGFSLSRDKNGGILVDQNM